jgi:uncharacterized membrane protein
VAEPLVVGLLAPERLAGRGERLAEELPGDLAERHPGVEWSVVAETLDPASPQADSRELVDSIRRVLLARGWELAIGLTDLPLRDGRHPVSAHASATHGVGLVSVPALGAIRVGSRLSAAVLRLLEGLLGESGGDGHGRIAGRLHELASPLGRARVHEDGSVRFVSAALRGNLRLLVGMVRANQPSQLIARLSAALVGVLGTAAFALATSDIWRLADAMSWPQLVALSLLSIAATVTALILAHGLWERAESPQARERVALFNVATVLTLALGALALYAALVVIALVCALALVPDGLQAEQIGHRGGVATDLHLAWLAASLATVGGALGSLVEDDVAVSDATYRNRGT